MISNGSISRPASANPKEAVSVIPSLYPTANGAPQALSGDERNDRIIAEFLAAYHDINLGWSRLRELRTRPDGAGFARDQRAALETVEEALRRRDELEDRYAPFGVITEPKTKDGFTVDVRFKFGNRDGRGRPRTDIYSIETYLPMSLPAGMKLEDLPCIIEGPGINDD